MLVVVVIGLLRRATGVSVVVHVHVDDIHTVAIISAGGCGTCAADPRGKVDAGWRLELDVWMVVGVVVSGGST